jgi:GTP cyclohydrolase-4
MKPTSGSRVPDVQASAPTVQVSLSRVGVTNVEKVIRVGPAGAAQLYYAKLDCFVDLGPRQKGAHMSRFEEVVNDVIGEVVLGEGGFKAEQLAQQIAERVRARQDARRAEVTIAARFPEQKPVSGIPTQVIYTLFGSAMASERGTRRLVGVAAHNERGFGTLHLGLPERCDTDPDARELLAIVEDSNAQRRPRFVEDCVREAIRGAIERFAGLPADAFLSSRQENLETIHQHNVIAERFGLIGELRRELDAGEQDAHHTTMREWLDAAS